MDVKIGLEIHCQLNTKSKLFCSCKNSVAEEPNVNCCPVCLGMPGAKPVFNKEVLKKALKVALALKCKINRKMVFSRKSYFFPDLPNNYQITQYEFPLANLGKFEGVTIRRLHIEEDPGKLVHKENFVLIDYNRSGTPLIEIVTEPDIKSAEQAKKFLSLLTTTLEYLGVYFKASEASLRCDVNVSINNGERVEVKNVNGINDVKKVIEYEIQRQNEIKAVQETRGWDSSKGITYEMRTKESEKDYGYITEPNLPVFEIEDELVTKVHNWLPELGHDKVKRFVEEYKIAKDDAEILTKEIELADLFEKVARHIDPIFAAKWLRRELVKLLDGKRLSEISLDEGALIQLMELFAEKKITDKVAKELMEKLLDESFDVKKYVEEKGLVAVSDEWELMKVCVEVINENPKPVNDYKNGNENALNYLVGQIIKKTKGKASPDVCKKLLKEKLV